jgi:hypothetical protein
MILFGFSALIFAFMGAIVGRGVGHPRSYPPRRINFFPDLEAIFHGLVL